MHATKKSEPWKNKPSPAPCLVGIGLVCLVTITFGIIVGWVFPSSVGYRAAVEVLRDIVQVDGVLIGFVGLVTTLAITELGKVARDLANPAVVLPPEKGGKDQMSMILDGLSVVRNREWFTVTSAGGSLILLVGSIITSLVGISFIQPFTNAEVSIFILPICTLLGGIIAIFLILVFSVMQAHP